MGSHALETVKPERPLPERSLPERITMERTMPMFVPTPDPPREEKRNISNGAKKGRRRMGRERREGWNMQE